jgi:hypothetical protein
VICGRREGVLQQAASQLSPAGERVLPVKADIINISTISGSIVNKYFHGGSYEVSNRRTN